MNVKTAVTFELVLGLRGSASITLKILSFKTGSFFLLQKLWWLFSGTPCAGLGVQTSEAAI